MYTQADIDRYVETYEWVSFMADLNIDDPAFERGLKIRGFKPRIGPL